MADPSDLLKWPRVPAEQRPKKLYHAGLVDDKAEKSLSGKGWSPTDVRLLPNVTDEDRRLALKAWLEGIRFGTIELDPRLAKWLELESKVYEIHKGVADRPKVTDPDEVQPVDLVLDFARSNPWTTTTADKISSTRKNRGPRPNVFKEEK